MIWHSYKLYLCCLGHLCVEKISARRDSIISSCFCEFRYDMGTSEGHVFIKERQGLCNGMVLVRDKCYFRDIDVVKCWPGVESSLNGSSIPALFLGVVA